MSCDPRLEEIRKLFLAVKFSDKDSANLNKRIQNTSIRRLEGRIIRGTLTGLTKSQFLSHLESLRTELLLSDQDVSRLSRVAHDCESGHDCDQGECLASVLQEVNPHRDLFGYVAAARSADGSVDVVHVACEAECQLESSCCGSCFTPERQRLDDSVL